MPANRKTSAQIGAIYRVTSADNALMREGYMKGRLRPSDAILCLERQHAKVHRYALLLVAVEGVQIYPDAFWFLSQPIGTLTTWQPTSIEFRRLWAEFTLKGEGNQPHPLAREMVGLDAPAPPQASPLPMRSSLAQGGE